jgi:hypothetical protein
MSSFWSHSVCILGGYTIAKYDFVSPWIAALILYYFVSNPTRAEQVKTVTSTLFHFTKKLAVTEYTALRHKVGEVSSTDQQQTR